MIANIFFDRKNILHLQKDFDSLRQSGRTFATSSFMVVSLKRTLHENSFFPFLWACKVSKKNLSKATDRNKVRRLIFEVLRKTKEHHFLSNSFIKQKEQLLLLLVYKKKHIEKYDYYQKELLHILTRLYEIYS